MAAAKFLRYQKLLAVASIPIIWAVLIYLNPASGPDYWLEYWWMAGVAFAISIIVNTVGISGAALSVPFFILIFPYLAGELSSIQSVKLGLINESFGLASSALAFLGFGLVDRKIAVTSIVTALPFLALGALLVLFIPESILLLMIAALLLTSIFFMRYAERITEHRKHEHRGGHVDITRGKGTKVALSALDGRVYRYTRTKTGYLKRVFGYGTGAFFQGAVGFGIGELGLISMIISRIPVRIAIGTSHLIVAITAITATGLHFALGIAYAGAEPSAFPWNIIFMTVPAVIIAGQVSPYIASRLPVKMLERVIAALFFVIAAALIILALS